MSAAFWFRNFDDLVSLGYHVYAIDLLGWGRSERPAFRGCTPEQGIAWYLDSFNGVISSLKLSKFSLLGHSLGAYLSMEYTNCKPHMVENLVLVSPAGAVRSVPVSRAAFFSLTPQLLVRRGGLLGFLLFNAHYPRSKMYVQHRLRDYTYHLAAQFPPSGELAVRPIIKLFGPRRAECIRPLIERTKFFSVPVHIVCGDTDSSMPLEDVHTLYRDMKRKGFNVQLSTVVGSDHCPMLEKPDDFFNLMSAITKTTTPKFTPISGPL